MSEASLTRSIPAHAGEPRGCNAPQPLAPVYPRPRGGAISFLVRRHPSSGLSPPTRGSHVVLRGVLQLSRSIPAHAGEPADTARRLPGSRVYPRPRGGAAPTVSIDSVADGLSPPTRGSLAGFAPFDGPLRSIPAHAGEPPKSCPVATNDKVYPRPRGGAGYIGLKDFRGEWSIPAHAGEPWTGRRPRLRQPVYPRPRGGARRCRWRTGA